MKKFLMVVLLGSIGLAQNGNTPRWFQDYEKLLYRTVAAIPPVWEESDSYRFDSSREKLRTGSKFINAKDWYIGVTRAAYYPNVPKAFEGMIRYGGQHIRDLQKYKFTDLPLTRRTFGKYSVLEVRKQALVPPSVLITLWVEVFSYTQCPECPSIVYDLTVMLQSP